MPFAYTPESLELRQKALKLLADGKTFTEVVDETGVALSTLRRWANPDEKNEGPKTPFTYPRRKRNYKTHGEIRTKGFGSPFRYGTRLPVNIPQF